MNRGIRLLGAAVVFALMLAPGAWGQKVGNPQSGTLKGFVDSGSFAAGTKALRASFTSPVELFHGGSISKDGVIDVPASALDQVTVPIPDFSGSAQVCSFSVTNAS